jgi:putative peptidoglycan lipid II flippase
VSWLNYAFRFLQLPIGLFGVAIGVVSATRFADAAADRDDARMAAQMNEALRLLAFLCVPATVGLFVLSEPIVRLIYERGAFAHGDTVSTAAALRAYTVGLCAYAAVKVLAPAFYARGSARAPMLASLGAVAINVGFGLAFHERWGFEALALGTSFGAIANFAVLMTAFYARAPAGSLLALVAPIAKIVVASVACGGAAWGVNEALHARVHDTISTLAAVAAGALAYAAASLALRLEEARRVWAKLARRGS